MGGLSSRMHIMNHFISQRERHVYLKADQAKGLSPFLLQVQAFLCNSLPYPTCAGLRSKGQATSSEAVMLL